MQDKIRQVALRWLARRDYSQHEIAQKLALKGYPQDAIHHIINDLVTKGLIKDQRFAEHYRHWRQSKGFGPLRISAELQIRGVSTETIAEVIQITDNIWFTEARKVWQKHFKNKPPSDFHHRAKQMRFLQHKGFTREQITAAIPGNRNTDDE
jgi:regulatory protein